MAKQSKKSEKKVLRLKPGNHQFVPGEHACHNNDNTSSAALYYYCEAYPHVKDLLEPDIVEPTAESNNETQPE